MNVASNTVFQKGATVKGKTGKHGEETTHGNKESEDSSKPKMLRKKAETKGFPPTTKGKAAKKTTESEAGEQETEECVSDVSEKKKGVSPKHSGKQQKKKKSELGLEPAGQEETEEASKGIAKKQPKGLHKEKKGAVQQAVRTSQGQQPQDSSEEDDIPLQAIAKTHKVLVYS